MTPLFFIRGSLSLGAIQEVFDGITSFEVHLYSIFLAGSFEVFTQPFVIWHHYVVLVLVAIHVALGFLFVALGWCPHFYFYPVDCPNQGIYIWSGLSSDVALPFCNNSGLELMVFALWCSVPMTMYLALIAWLLSHCIYKSVCVGFLKDRCSYLPIFTWC